MIKAKSTTTVTTPAKGLSSRTPDTLPLNELKSHLRQTLGRTYSDMVDVHRTIRVTPKMAHDLLKHNLCNRKLENTYVGRLAGQMSEGKWVLNGESLKFDVEGRLIDGQHRLSAVVASGVTVPFMIQHNADFSAIHTIDSNKKRTCSGDLGIAKVANAAFIANVTKHLVPYYEGIAQHTVYLKGGLDRATMYDWAMDHLNGLEDSVRKGYVFKRRCDYFSKESYAVVYYLVKEKDPVLADAFFDTLTQDTGVVRAPVIQQLRDFSRKVNGKLKGLRSSTRLQIVNLIRCWNAYRQNKARFKPLKAEDVAGQPSELLTYPEVL